MSSSFGFNTTGDEVVSKFRKQVEGRVFLITGPSPGGIGEATVLALARARPASLILVGRTPAKYASVADEIRALDGNIAVKTYGVDLGSLASVRAGAAEILKETPRIDVLINNAGVMVDERRLSPDGVELTFATNHVGPFLFTNFLLSALRVSDGPRVVNDAFRLFHNLEYDDYNWEKWPYEWSQAYAESKIANIHFTQYLAKHSNGLIALAPHPGTIWGTSIMGTMADSVISQTKDRVTSLGIREKTLEQGASTILVAALDPALAAHNGAYLADCQVEPVQGPSLEKTGLPEKLWKITEGIVGEEFKL